MKRHHQSDVWKRFNKRLLIAGSFLIVFPFSFPVSAEVRGGG